MPQQNLTLEQISQILAGLNGQSGGGTYTDPTGQTYHGMFDTNGQRSGEAWEPTTPQAQNFFRDVVNGRNQVGDMQEVYGADGRYQGTGAIPKDTTKMDFAIMAAMLGGAGLAAGGAFGGAGAGLAGAEAAGGAMYPGAAGWGATAAGVDSIAAANMAALAGGGTAAAGGLGGGASAAGAGTSAAGLGGGGAAASGGGLFGGTGSTLGGIGSLIGSNASWLAPLVGGLLGSKPTTKEENVVKKMDPRMDALVYGDGGLLNNATDWYKNNKSGMNDAMRGAIAQNRSLLQNPATMQGYQNIAAQGQGLLCRAPASNPFTNGQPPQFGTNRMDDYLRLQRGY